MTATRHVGLAAERAWHRLRASGRPLLTLIAVVLAVAAAVPPVGSYARQYAFVQALQFAVFGVAAPALLVLGAPRWLARARPKPAVARLASIDASCAAATSLLPFIAMVIIWRLPTVLRALDTYSALTAVELTTLAAAGVGLWLKLAGTPYRPPELPHPMRAGMAAASAWTIWVIAYLTGMSAALIPARVSAAQPVVSAVADRQLTAAILWAVPAICLGPFIYGTVMAWLDRREHATADPFTTVHGESDRDGGVGLQSPRGWRSPR